MYAFLITKTIKIFLSSSKSYDEGGSPHRYEKLKLYILYHAEYNLYLHILCVNIHLGLTM